MLRDFFSSRVLRRPGTLYFTVVGALIFQTQDECKLDVDARPPALLCGRCSAVLTLQHATLGILELSENTTRIR